MDTKSCNEQKKIIGPDWSCLNSDLTEYIFKKLPVADLISCRNVCRSWFYVSQNHIISNLPFKCPILVLPKHYLPKHLSENSSYFFHHSLEDTQLYCFFNPVAYELYPLTEKSKDLLKDMIFTGSSNGWALFANSRDMIMFNAPMGTAIRCPGSPPYGKIMKALLLGDPILDTRKRKNSHGIIVAMDYTNFYDICFALCGTTKFISNLPESVYYPHDVICFDGLVYVVLTMGSIQAWDFSQILGKSNPKKLLLEHCFHPSFNRGKELTFGHQLRLVDSSGKLWLVSKLGFQTQSQIGVYMMNFEEKKWVEMESLGDRVVVLLKGQSISFLPMDPAKYKRNCVYFEDHDRDFSKCIYVYNLDDVSVTKSHI